MTEDGTLTASGQVTVTDADHDATAAFSGNATGTYGSFVVDPATGQWTYTLDNANHQDLSANDHLTETFTVTVTDDQGATTTQSVTITVNGTNDAPVISSGTQSGSVTEDGTLTASGQVTVTDADHDATAAFSGNATGTYGSFVVDPATGQWTYTLDNANHQDLSANDHLTETFTVTVTDDQGATTTQSVTITVNGTNDAPMITSGRKRLGDRGRDAHRERPGHGDRRDSATMTRPRRFVQTLARPPAPWLAAWAKAGHRAWHGGLDLHARQRQSPGPWANDT